MRRVHPTVQRNFVRKQIASNRIRVQLKRWESRTQKQFQFDLFGAIDHVEEKGYVVRLDKQNKEVDEKIKDEWRKEREFNGRLKF